MADEENQSDEIASEAPQQDPTEAAPIQENSEAASDSQSENPSSDSLPDPQMQPESSPEATPSRETAGAEVPALSTSSELTDTVESNMNIEKSLSNILDEATSEALGSHDFAEWIGMHIMQFLDITDIRNTSQRREALLKICASEEKIRERLILANCFLHIQGAYGLASESSQLVDHCQEYNAKLRSMKEWLSL